MRDTVRFSLNGVQVEVRRPLPTRTLLEWLREDRRLTGTKEGCAEGDCGACTVMVVDPAGKVRAINSCIQFLPMVDGCAVTTVEGLGGADPVQKELVREHGSQCGFCTPGFVMALHAHHAKGGSTESQAITDAIAGNLCRCTGYRPIVEAMTKVAGLPVEPAPKPPARAGSASFDGSFHAPRSLAELLAMRARQPEAMLLAGATDLGLLASRSRKPPAAVIHVAHVPELTVVSETDKQVTIGAAASYAQAMPALIANYPALKTYLARLGSRQIRTMGTLGGNIGTASPIGDMPPVLIALEARLRLTSTRGARDLALEDFFLDYRKTALAADEVIESITVPKLRPHEVFFCDKLSKRRDQDISTVAAGYRLKIKSGRVEDARIAFGGMAATPKRALAVEAALKKDGFAAAIATVETEFKPIDDWRGSAAYRLQAAKNLLRRLELRVTSPGQAVEVEAL